MEKKMILSCPTLKKELLKAAEDGRISGRDPLYPSKSPQQPYGAAEVSSEYDRSNGRYGGNSAMCLRLRRSDCRS